MLYRVKLFAFKSSIRIAHAFPNIAKRVAASSSYSRDRVAKINDNELRAAQIRKHVPGKSFLDAGCMYRTNGAHVFYAEQCGAAHAVGMDVLPASDAFLAYKREHNSNAEFFRGDINDREMMQRIGMTDVVFCNGVLYHTPDPFLMMSRLREITRETLLLYTATIPEMRGLENMSVFYPYISEQQRKILNPPRPGLRPSLSKPYDPEAGYANWFWGMTPSCVASLAKCAGFSVDHVIKDRPFATMLVCSAVKKPRSARDPTIYKSEQRVTAAA